MGIVNNSYVPIAATALGVTVTEGAGPIVEQLLNDFAVSSINAAEVTDKGKCIVLVDTVGGMRPVADSSGNVKLFADGAAVVALAKKSNLPGGQGVVIVKKAINKPVGDPITTLKAQHKQASTEAASALAPAQKLAQQIIGAQSLGWDAEPEGSATRGEYEDLIARQASVAEWKDKCDSRVATLAAALTAAGIDPVTYLPLPTGH